MASLLRAAVIACAAIACVAQDSAPPADPNTDPAARPGGPPTAVVKNGTYTGVRSTSYNQDFFLGVPFAQPPVQNLRFRQPQPLNTKWTTARAANAYSAACVGYGGDNAAYPSQSEDCLYLNVVRPAGVPAATKLPVGFWIHGGAYYMGSAIDPRYNLSDIVQQSVKVGKPFIGVSINYRVSAWGFLSSQEVVAAGQANLGLQDQRIALRWVQENIAGFGGDPTKVTIWGESAGAGSVGNQLIAFGGRDDKLFRAAIMESGGPIALLPLAPNQPAFNNLTAATGCSSAADKLACLRQLPFAQLNNVLNTTNLGQAFAPVQDGDFIKDKASVQLAQGKFVKVPIINGANSDEGTVFGPTGVETTQDFFNNLVSYPVPAPVPSAFANQILTAYPDVPAQGIPGSPPLDPNFRPGPPFGAQFRRSSAYYGDATFIAARRYTCQQWAKYGLTAYCYRFNTLPTGLPPVIGVTHFQEVAWVFDNTIGRGYAVNPFAGQPQSYVDLATLMSSSWASFINDLDPNSWKRSYSRVGTPDWPKYKTTGAQDIVWDANVTALAVVETDNFRADGIKLISQNFATVYKI